jgi:predicted nucleic acid-binding protein
MVLYADTSALVKLLGREAESAALNMFVGPTLRLASSVIARVELLRSVGRHAPELLPAAERVVASLDFVPLERGVALRATTIAPMTLRSLDAIHVASALSLNERLEALITYDRRMAEAAEALGIRVLSPR